MQHEPTEEGGTFEELSFALLLIRALDQRWTGTLVVDPPFDMLHLIQIDRGLVSRVVVPDDYARIGEIVVDAGVIMDSELDLALERGILLGQALAEARLIDAKTLQRALVLQILKRLVRLFDFPSATEWSFVPELDAFDGMPDGVRVDTLRILWAGLSAHGEIGSFLDTALGHVGESSFQLRHDAQVARFGFQGDATRLVGLLNAERMTLEELIETHVAPEDVCRLVVYLLAITRYLDLSPVGEDVDAASALSTTGSSDDQVPASEPSSSDATQQKRVARIRLRRVKFRAAAPDTPGAGEPPRPSPRSSEDATTSSSRGRRKRMATQDQSTMPSAGSAEQVLAEIASRLERLKRDSPFALLNVDAEHLASLDEDDADELLWDAYEKISRRWHPDNCPHDVAELREGMAKLHDAISDAYVSLADPSVRDAAIREALGISGPRPLSSGPVEQRDTVVDEPRRTGVTMPSVRAPSDAPRPRIPTPTRVPSFDSPTSAPTSSQAPDTHPNGEPSSEPASGKRLGEELKPSQLHERALIAMSQQQLSEALRFCLLACDAAPDNPDYVATSVWIRASMPRPDLKVLTLDLDDLLLQHEDHPTARYYRGVLRRRLGYDSAAKQDFERVLEIDPDHAGARRQMSELAKAFGSTP